MSENIKEKSLKDKQNGLKKTSKKSRKITQIRSKKITQIRSALGLSAAAFANRCGYAGSTILRMERGKENILDEFCSKLCSTYGVNPAWINDVTDEGDKNHVDDSQMFTDEKRFGKDFLPVDGAVPETQGERVRQVLNDSGLTQREFAAKIGTATSNLQDIMQGRRKLSVRYAEKIEKAMHVGVDWLLFGIEEAKEWPCSEEMMLFLKRNPEVRKKIWKMMKKSQVNGREPENGTERENPRKNIKPG